MAQRLVLRAKDGKVPVREIEQFANTAVQYGVKMESASFDVVDGELRIMVTLPKDVRVVGAKTIKLKAKTAKEQAVEKQIADHKKKKKNGETAPYVPPVGRKGKPPVQKAKCPVCNVRKPIVTIAGVKSIKPHVVKGEPCSGGGQQYVPPKKMK